MGGRNYVALSRKISDMKQLAEDDEILVSINGSTVKRIFTVKVTKELSVKQLYN